MDQILTFWTAAAVADSEDFVFHTIFSCSKESKIFPLSPNFGGGKIWRGERSDPP